MPTIADAVDDFVRSARAGTRPRVHVSKQYAELFLGELMRQGIRLADHCLDEVRDPELREIIRNLLLASAAGAALGAAVGASLGPKGAATCALVGAGVGLAVGAFAYSVKLREEAGASGPELVVEAAA